MGQLPPGIIVYEGVGLGHSTTALLAPHQGFSSHGWHSQDGPEVLPCLMQAQTLLYTLGRSNCQQILSGVMHYIVILSGGPKYPKEAL